MKNLNLLFCFVHKQMLQRFQLHNQPAFTLKQCLCNFYNINELITYLQVPCQNCGTKKNHPKKDGF
jgi:hypothetical protein